MIFCVQGPNGRRGAIGEKVRDDEEEELYSVLLSHKHTHILFTLCACVCVVLLLQGIPGGPGTFGVPGTSGASGPQVGDDIMKSVMLAVKPPIRGLNSCVWSLQGPRGVRGQPGPRGVTGLPGPQVRSQ